MTYILEDLNLLKVQSENSKDKKTGKFVIEPLSPGYGVTVGNTLRRVLLASLEGYAVHSVKISGADHEYSTIKGVKEDAVDIILNLKSLKFKMTTDEAVLTLSVKGPKKITASDFKKNAYVEIVDEDAYIATVEKGNKLDLEITVNHGRGYVPIERKSEMKVPIGTILVDSAYTPVKKVRFDVENARVGGMTNYNKLIVEITTDGSISPSEALSTAAMIMTEHLQVIVEATSEKAKTDGIKQVETVKSRKTKE